ncbi:MAG: hypothetical protein ACOYJQ_16870 [Pseudochelatococcus sp.]|uniref:hypothetical protein n=1 Tax=Pseudochelatococcus sp. TaxID=2020869 RepID=UPI003D8A7DC8
MKKTRQNKNLKRFHVSKAVGESAHPAETAFAALPSADIRKKHGDAPQDDSYRCSPRSLKAWKRKIILSGRGIQQNNSIHPSVYCDYKTPCQDHY